MSEKNKFIDQLYREWCESGQMALTETEFKGIACFVLNKIYRTFDPDDVRYMRTIRGFCVYKGEEVAVEFMEYRGRPVAEWSCGFEKAPVYETKSPKFFRKDIPTPGEIREELKRLNHPVP